MLFPPSLAHTLQLRRVSWRLTSTFRFLGWSSPYEQRAFQSPPCHHSNLLLTNSYLPRILHGRGCLTDSQPWAHMQGVINRPFWNLSGGQSALFMQCTDSRFHFLSGDKLSVSSPDHHLQFRTVEYSQGGSSETLLSVSSSEVLKHLEVLKMY